MLAVFCNRPTGVAFRPPHPLGHRSDPAPRTSHEPTHSRADVVHPKVFAYPNPDINNGLDPLPDSAIDSGCIDHQVPPLLPATSNKTVGPRSSCRKFLNSTSGLRVPGWLPCFSQTGCFMILCRREGVYCLDSIGLLRSRHDQLAPST
jgi:hypothetical protein